MKKITLILFALFIFCNVKAQYFWESGCGYTPVSPIETDSIYLIDSLTLSATDFRINYRVNFFSDTIVLSLCYRRPGGAIHDQFLKEYTNIGKLKKGSYLVIIEGFYENLVDLSCFQSDSFFNTISFPLEVFAAPNTISDIALSSVSISPTIVQDKIEISGLPNERAVIVVYDLQGKMLHNITTKNSTASLQMGNLASGVYIVIVRVGSEQKRWKILKE